MRRISVAACSWNQKYDAILGEPVELAARDVVRSRDSGGESKDLRLRRSSG